MFTIERDFKAILALSKEHNHSRAILCKIYTQHIDDPDPDLSYLETVLDENNQKIISSSRYTQEDLDNNREETLKYIKEDHQRLKDFGDTWYTFGIRAFCQINIPFEVTTSKGKEINFLIQELCSGGIWGIESGSDPEYLKDIEKEQVNDLKHMLKILNVAGTEII